MARLLGMNPADPKTHAMVAVAQRYDLDPLLKHVVVIPGSGPYLTRDGLLHVAHRSGQFDGMVIESGPDLVDGEWRCVVSVYRKDMARPFTFPGRYSATGGNRKYAPEMAIKVAECMALRRAFDVSGMGVLEEAEVGNGPAPAPRPVERLATTPADDPWQSPPVDVTDAVVVEDPVGEAAAEGVSPTAPHPEAKGNFTALQIDLGKRQEAEGWSRDDVKAWVGLQVGRPIGSTKELTSAEVADVRAILRGARREVTA